MNLKHEALDIARKAIADVLPDEAVKRALSRLPSCSGDTVIVSVGKAGWQMAHAAAELLPGEYKSGYVITKYDHSKGALPGFTIFEAAHPIPDENGAAATEAVIRAVSGLKKEDRVILLISGGGSALFEKSLVPLDELKDITDQLLACGADITEINTIRKRLSAVKGGRFARLCAPARVYSVILSDVLGDRADMIASGPACPDASAADEAVRVAEKYGLRLSDNAMQLLKFPPVTDLDNAEAYVTGSVKQFCASAARRCEALGYKTLILTDSLCCTARDAGSFLGSIAASHANSDVPLAFIAGGETVVRLTGSGAGGRNQEIALSAAEHIAGLDNVCILAVSSDGTDGPTDAAGGIVDGSTVQLLQAQGRRISDILDENDSYHGLQLCDGLVFTGATGTNVNDVAVILIK